MERQYAVDRETALAIQGRLIALVSEAREIRIHEHETAPATEFYENVIPRIDDLLDAAITCFGVVLEHYEKFANAQDDHRPEEDFLRVVDNMMENSPGSRIADLAFMGRMELSSRKTRLSQLHKDSPGWGLVSAATSAKRRVVKAVSALEFLIRESANLPGQVSQEFVSELTSALEVRRFYAKFRKKIRDATRAHEDPVRRLRLAAVQLAVLVGHPVYEHLRVMDRMEFRRFQTEILAWLREPSPELLAGKRLWQDLSTFVSLLTHINRRAELMRHDVALIDELRSTLDKGPEHFAANTEAISDRAKGLCGRDDEFDALFASSDPSFFTWRHVFDRMALELEASHAGAPAPVPMDVTDMIIALHKRGGHGSV